MGYYTESSQQAKTGVPYQPGKGVPPELQPTWAVVSYSIPSQPGQVFFTDLHGCVKLMIPANMGNISIQPKSKQQIPDLYEVCL